MKRIAFIALGLFILATVATSCNTHKNCPGMGVEKAPVEQPNNDKA